MTQTLTRTGLNLSKDLDTSYINDANTIILKSNDLGQSYDNKLQPEIQTGYYLKDKLSVVDIDAKSYTIDFYKNIDLSQSDVLTINGQFNNKQVIIYKVVSSVNQDITMEQVIPLVEYVFDNLTRNLDLNYTTKNLCLFGNKLLVCNLAELIERRFSLGTNIDIQNKEIQYQLFAKSNYAPRESLRNILLALSSVVKDKTNIKKALELTDNVTDSALLNKLPELKRVYVDIIKGLDINYIEYTKVNRIELSRSRGQRLQLIHLENVTLENKNYRNVIYTNDSMQLVLMYLNKGVEIGWETHKNQTQFFRLEKGKIKVQTINEVILEDGDSVVVPAGTHHNVIALEDSWLYTIYTPPVHKPNTLQKTKLLSD